ncbi:hypothetical protein [Brevibacterium sediminis]
MFIEQDHHHWKNRRDAHYTSVKPAILANGDAGVWLRIGGTFAVLSKDEFAAIADRAKEAIDTAERPYISRFNALVEKNRTT